MEWDLGPQGLGVLLLMSIGFGVLAQLALGRLTTVWVGALAAVGHFVVGLLVSEWWFGWATEEDLQPNIDGLSFDEVLLITLVPGGVGLLVARLVLRRAQRHRHQLTS